MFPILHARRQDEIVVTLKLLLPILLLLLDRRWTLCRDGRSGEIICGIVGKGRTSDLRQQCLTSGAQSIFSPSANLARLAQDGVPRALMFTAQSFEASSSVNSRPHRPRNPFNPDIPPSYRQRRKLIGWGGRMVYKERGMGTLFPQNNFLLHCTYLHAFLHRTPTMSFAESSHNFRLVDTVLHAQCQDRHGNLHNSELNLDHILGNRDGQFDVHGKHFHESSGICGLNHTTLVATLRREDGTYHAATIDLDRIVKNDNGRLEKA
ncbi:Cyanovirin-N [Favolaschia claudopus]|uniref:Cyanovirin-N n=1 Tax=Favolaschia claudopus TaxID=2862362 RepID=A0AAV9ZZQ1_9AGAR